MFRIGLNGAWDRARAWYDKTISDVPWLRALGPVASVAGILVFINNTFPEQWLRIDEIPYFWPVSATAVTFLYFFVVAIYSSALLKAERRLRSMEQAFNYDKRGTLFNGREPNIAFRIATFAGVLSGLEISLGDAVLLRSAMKDAGTDAAVDFASNLPHIYDANVRAKKGGAPWQELRFGQKLHEWADYDSATGWGIVTARIDKHTVLVKITHYHDLFTHTGGMIFAFFLQGYCETVLSAILAQQTAGSYADATRVQSQTEPEFRDESVIFSYAIFE